MTVVSMGGRIFETYHNRSRFVVENGVVRVYVSGKEDPVVLDVVCHVGGRAATVGIDPLR